MQKKGENKICGIIDFFSDASKTCLEYFLINKIEDIKNYKNPMPDLCDNLGDFIYLLLQEIHAGIDNNYIPIIVGYNLYYYIRTLIHELQSIFTINVLAQNENNIYCIEIFIDENQVLKFWDIKHLADKELILSYSNYECMAYAIPDFIKKFLEQNEYIKEDDLAKFVLTKSSMTRVYARKFIGTLSYINANNHKMKLNYVNRLSCVQNNPKNFINYCLRKSCFNGGFSFVSNKRACKIYENVCEIDVNSMHHAHLCGHYMPVKFRKATQQQLWKILYYIKNKDTDYFLQTYSRPFTFALNAFIGLSNIRLKANSIFHKEKIGLIQREKFVMKFKSDCQPSNNLLSEENVKNYGFRASCEDANFSFNKLNFAKKINIFVNEVEFFNICQVYDFDNIGVFFGEISSNFDRPSDFNTLQTNVFYKQKEMVKTLINDYSYGKQYDKFIPNCIPESMRDEIKNGKIDKNEIKEFYSSYIKAKFNSVYGNQAQDVYKPYYLLNKDADIILDKSSIMKEDNFDEKIEQKEKSISVNYLYGTRIVAFSRTHLILAMKLLYDYDKDIKIISGDTDSIRFVSSKKDILKALDPLHNSITSAINNTLKRIRTNFPKQCCNLNKLGHFEFVETFKKRIDYANKMYVTLDNNNKIKMTFAGFDIYDTQKLLQKLVEKYGFDFIFYNCFGYNTTIDKKMLNSYEFIKPSKYYINNKPAITWKRKVDLNLLSSLKQENLENLINLSYFNNHQLNNPKFIYNNYIEIVDDTGEIKRYD